MLATVTAGLYISWNGLRLISAATRLQGVFFWEFLIYLIEGMVFLITGLQARTLVVGIRGYSIFDLAISAAVVSAVVIVARFVWMYPATYLPRWLIPAVRRKDPSPPWQWPFALAFTGIRGIVSLAAALAIPLTIESGAPFPQRDLILFLTFSVILVTLVGQGLLLPAVMRLLGLANAGQGEAMPTGSKSSWRGGRLPRGRIAGLDELATQRNLPDEVVKPLRAHNRDQLKLIEERRAMATRATRNSRNSATRSSSSSSRRNES